MLLDLLIGTPLFRHVLEDADDALPASGVRKGAVDLSRDLLAILATPPDIHFEFSACPRQDAPDLVLYRRPFAVRDHVLNRVSDQFAGLIAEDFAGARVQV